MTGGYDDDYKTLDSTEVLRPGSDWQEITSARLPKQLQGVRVITVNNRALLFGEWRHIFILTAPSLTLARVTGGWDGYNDKTREILEYNKDGDSWSKLGIINKGRGYHGLGVVSIADFKLKMHLTQ